MGLFLKQNTAVDVIVGPFVDSTDGNTVEAALTITSAEVFLSKNGGALAVKNEATSLIYDSLGYYDCNLNTTDTNTLGRLQLMIHEAGALPVYHEFMVVTANIYDTICSTDLLQTDLTQIGGVAQSATDLKDFADAGYDPATDQITGVKLCDLTTTTTTATAATSVTNDVGITQAAADKVWGTAARALTDKADFSLAADQSAVTVGTVNTALALTANNDKTGYTLTAAGIDSIWDEVAEGTLTARQAVRLFSSALFSKTSGGGTNTLVARDIGDTKNRITLTVDADGNRTASVVDGA